MTVIVAENAPPTVDAGPNQTVFEGATVTLAGTATDPNGDALSYQWTQTAGPAVTLDSPTAASTSFVAPDVAPGAPQTLTFQLTVDDGQSVVTGNYLKLRLDDLEGLARDAVRREQRVLDQRVDEVQVSILAELLERRRLALHVVNAGRPAVRLACKHDELPFDCRSGRPGSPCQRTQSSYSAGDGSPVQLAPGRRGHSPP